MKATEKNRQRLSNTQVRETNAKYGASMKRWKININTLDDYLTYMEEDLPNNLQK